MCDPVCQLAGRCEKQLFSARQSLPLYNTTGRSAARRRANRLITATRRRDGTKNVCEVGTSPTTTKVTPKHTPAVPQGQREVRRGAVGPAAS